MRVFIECDQLVEVLSRALDLIRRMGMGIEVLSRTSRERSCRTSVVTLLAELFMDVISDELARRMLEKPGNSGDVEAFHAAKQEIVCKCGSDISLSFMNR